MTETLDQNSRLEGRVAAILNAKELVINIGAVNGVKLGSIFAILSEKPIVIKDPTTGDLLDQIDREKVRVKVIEVRERVAICSTYRMTAGMDYSGVLSASKLLRAMEETKLETLKIADSGVPAPLTEEESYVKVNDRIVLIIGRT
jgi:hypothetical protein